MTMTELLSMCQHTIDAAEKEQNSAPTPEEHKATMSWLDEVNKRREASKES